MIDLAIRLHGADPLRGPGRRDRRRDVVEEAVVLVVVQDEDGLGPDLRVGGQRRDQPGDQEGAVGGRGAGVLAELVGRHNPGDLRQAVGGHVGGEGGDQVLAVRGRRIGFGGARRPCAAALVEDRVRADAAEVREVGKAIVAVVLVLLIDLPGDARRLQPLGVGRPFHALELRRVLGRIGVVVGLFWRVVDDDLAVVAGGEAAVAGEQVEPVGVGLGEDRAVVGVADREGVGERVVERQVRAGVVAHGQRRLGRDPGVVVLPPSVAALPAVVQAEHGLGPGGRRIQAEGADGGSVLGPLVPDRRAAGQLDGPGVAVAAHPAQRPEVVVERAVLLHQDHHVLDILEGAGDAVGGERERPGHRRRQGRRADRAGGELQEGSALVGCPGHVPPLIASCRRA